MSQPKPKYRFYATLLNAFQWYLDSDEDKSFQELIDKINRVPFSSEAADRGTSFNKLIDGMIISKQLGELKSKKGVEVIEYEGFEFPSSIAYECRDYLMHGIPQIRESGMLETGMGLIEVYGDMDYLLPGMEEVDLKTAKQYNLPKYIKTWQHIVYPFCTYLKTGIEYKFTYLATDFKSVVTEQYLYNHRRDQPRLISICVELAQFIEDHRRLITDTKIFSDPTMNDQ